MLNNFRLRLHPCFTPIKELKMITKVRPHKSQHGLQTGPLQNDHRPNAATVYLVQVMSG